jgi:uncharacterized protein (DUF1330 family)
MQHVEPGQEAFRALMAMDPAMGPVEMINMLRYREHADYGSGSAHSPCSGREAYLRYGLAVQAFLDRAGANIVWHGTPRLMFIGPQDKAWDDVLIVRYPDLRAFTTMITDPAYLEIAVHRTAALEDSRLIVAGPAKPSIGPD